MSRLGTNTTNSIPDSARKMKYIASVKAIDFDGTTDSLRILNAQGGDGNDFSYGNASNDEPFSFACWVKLNVTGTGVNSRATILAKGDSTYIKEYKIFLHDGVLMFDILDGTDNHYQRAQTVAGVLNADSSTWQHLAVTYNGVGGNSARNGMNIYIDGINATASRGGGGTYVAMHNTNSDLTFGNRLDYNNYDMDGQMSDIMMWKNYELSYMEIDAIFNNGVYSVDPTIDKGSYTGASSLVLWHKCDADKTLASASSSTVYSNFRDGDTPNTPSGGSVQELTSGEEFDNNCAGFEDKCWKVIDPAGTPAVYGQEDFSSKNHHSTYVNGTNLITDPPTSTSVSQEYAF